MSQLLIKGGHVLDPAAGVDGILDVLVAGERVVAVGENLDGGDRVLEARGKLVLPGFIDMHVHLREPGFEYKEDVASGGRAAVRGGFTAICCMPNTQPVMDNRTVVEFVRGQAARAGWARVYPVGAISKGLKGEELAEIADMRSAGIVGLSDDGKPVASTELMRLALQYAAPFDLPVISHAEDPTLSQDGVMHRGRVSSLLGLKGVPAEAESVMVARDLLLAGLTGGSLHIAHVSTAQSVELIAFYRSRGVRVTCEVTPHHLLLSDQAVRDTWYDTCTKVNPPLRSPDHVDALRRALREGLIDAIVTDHAPHHQDEKLVEYDYAQFGMVGLETAVSLVAGELVGKGVLDWPQVVALMSTHPARILGVEGGRLEAGGLADFTVIDPGQKVTVDPKDFVSKSRNTPFAGWQLTGAPWGTVVGGQVMMWEGTLTAR
ncbi:MAG TPA: dihydroorotase [Clostridiales bacterium UBA8153]|nr:dihydroorotase [Clostridiales bacterium UBA8153]